MPPNFSETIDTLIGFLFSYGTFIVIFVLILGYAFISRQRRNRAWAEVAQQLGLTFAPGNLITHPKASGNYRGHHISLGAITHGSGRSSTTYTRIVVFVDNRAEIYFALYPKRMFSRLGKLFGVQYVQLGDPDIDQRFVIKSRPENFAARLFSSAGLRAKILEAKSINFVMDGRELYYEKQGYLSDLEQLRFLFDLLVDVAEVIERA